MVTARPRPHKYPRLRKKSRSWRFCVFCGRCARMSRARFLRHGQVMRFGQAARRCWDLPPEGARGVGI